MRCSPTAEALLTETIAAWNGIPHTAPVKFTIVPESIRLEFYKRLQEFGDDGIRNAVAGMQEADFFKTKAKTKPSFLQFLKDKMFQGCIDGTYQNVHENKTPNKENLNETARDRLSPEDRAFFDSIGK
ncbi:MAG: hypothetical protein LBT46_15320 [Planctomycetaceae bacterium]|nr:hypothetical protein [Planctomycetaceae bacterium]